MRINHHQPGSSRRNVSSGFGYDPNTPCLMCYLNLVDVEPDCIHDSLNTSIMMPYESLFSGKDSRCNACIIYKTVHNHIKWNL